MRLGNPSFWLGAGAWFAWFFAGNGAVWAAPELGSRALEAAKVGVLAPALHAQRVVGPDPVVLSHLDGRVVVLDFWATWCEPCRPIMRVLDSLHRAHHGQGLSVVGISGESMNAIAGFLQRDPVHYTIARDRGGTARAYGVGAIPTLVMIDRLGKVREIMVGVSRPNVRRLAQLIRRMLAEPEPQR